MSDQTATAVSPYLSDNFAPVHEEIEADDLRVLGELPLELAGMFVRVGPNPQFDPIGRYHWFDGDGMLHGVRISGGKASYRNRYVRTAGFAAEREAGKALWTGLLEPPRFDNPHGPFKNAANTALVWHDGRLLALWEGGDPHEIAVPGLETVGPYTYCGKLASAFTAHPKVDAETGELLFFGYSLMAPPYVKYSVVSAAGELLRTAPIDLPLGVMMHDFAITARYTIFMDLPVTFRLERALRGEPLLAFERDRPSRFGILPRHGANADVRWFEGPSCFVFHTLNAHEEGDEVVLTACRSDSTDVLQAATRPRDGDTEVAGGERAGAFLHEWRFNLASGAMREHRLDDVAAEFPRVNDDLLGRATRFGYAARFAARGDDAQPLADGIIMYDLAARRSDTHTFGSQRFGGEPVFVPRPGGSGEDDGWLVTFVYDGAEGTSELIVLNARDITAGPIARVLIPQRVPYGFHGAWLGEECVTAGG